MAYYQDITLEKGMYGVPGKSFTEVLEGLDGSAQYEGTSLGGLDAYERQLKRFGIRVSGPGSDTVEKFFMSAGSAALFPEYVSRAVAKGIGEANKLGDLVATVTKIDAMDYRPIKAASEDGKMGLTETAEGTAMPAISIRTAPNLIRLQKRGRMINSSYEALRFQKLDLFTVLLRQIGAYIAHAQAADAVEALTDGDGNVPGVTFDAAGGELSYGDIVGLWGKLSPFTLNTIVAGTDALQQIMGMPEFRDGTAGLDFHGTGRMVTPMGAALVHVPDMAAGKLIGLDKGSALELVQAGDIQTEYDKLIDRQLERAAISVTSGFARIYADAAKGVSFA